MQRALPLLLIVPLLIAFSLLGTAMSGTHPGFNALPAVFLCVAACLPLRWLVIPAVAWMISYPLTNLQQGYGFDWQLLVAIVGLAAVVGLGISLRRRRNLGVMLGGAVAAAMLFYFLTNIGSWLLLPDYPKTWAGFLQAQWTGAPHHPLPTWVFLRSGIAAQLLFTALFLLGQRQTALRWQPAQVEAPGKA